MTSHSSPNPLLGMRRLRRVFLAKTAIGAVTLAMTAGITVFLLWPPQSGQSKQPPKTVSPTAIPVQTAVVLAKDVPIERTGLGVVTALTAVDVKVRVDGPLDKLMFAEGQDVKAGDVIAQIDPRPYEVAVDLAEAVYNKDLAQLDAAKIDEARAKRLISTGSGTSQASDTASAQVAMLQATTDGDKSSIAKAQLDLSYATISAPIRGRAGFRQAEEGAIVRTSDASGIVTITQIRPITVEFTLTQDELPALMAGQSNGQHLPVTVNNRDGSQHLSDGKLQVIDTKVDSTTGMVKLKALFPNEDLALWPGELVTAKIQLSTNHDAMVVPTAAIQNGQTGPYLFVVKPDNKVTAVSIKTGPAAGDMTTVVGLNLGDTVVTSGQSRLSDGALISAARATENVASSQKGQIQ